MFLLEAHTVQGRPSLGITGCTSRLCPCRQHPGALLEIQLELSWCKLTSWGVLGLLAGMVTPQDAGSTGCVGRNPPLPRTIPAAVCSLAEYHLPGRGIYPALMNSRRAGLIHSAPLKSNTTEHIKNKPPALIGTLFPFPFPPIQRHW